MAYKFNLPLDSQLTVQQRSALYETEAIAIQGGPGTGKSVVSLKRHINNISRNKNSQLVTFTKTLTEFFIQSCISAGEYKASRYIESAYKFRNEIDGEIIIDEAQDLPKDILERFKSNSKSVSYGADSRQQLYPDKGCSSSDLKGVFQGLEDVTLEENFRNTYSIMNFVKYLFPKKAITQDMLDELKDKNEGNKPILLKHSSWNAEDRKKTEQKILKELLTDLFKDDNNIAILVPFEKNVDYYYELVRSMVPRCSKYHNKMEDIDVIENLHVTTFKSSKGLEFDQVIIPDFSSYKYIIDKFDVITEADYFVGLTRAKTSLFLIGNADIPVSNDVYRCEKI